MPSNEIMIFGAGISGLVAAINLAKAGFKVTVSEKRDYIGGSPKWHPSVHQQVLDVRKTSKYLDIDISSCFSPVRRHIFHFYGRTSFVDAPMNSYVCEKGQRLTSIENFLFKEAKGCGVHFIFGEPLNSNVLRLWKSGGSRCIVATGLETKLYKAMDIKHVQVAGFRAFKAVNEGGSTLSFFGDYTNRDFAYVASTGDLMFSLLFSRERINEKNLSIFASHLLKSEGIHFDNWHYSTGCIPLETNLIKNGMVMAGTISGMIDPFFLNGISGALISGKIAALYFIDPEESVREFKYFTRYFHLKRALKVLSIKSPNKRFTFPVFTFINSKIRSIGVV